MMRLPALTAAILIVPAGLTIGRARSPGRRPRRRSAWSTPRAGRCRRGREHRVPEGCQGQPRSCHGFRQRDLGRARRAEARARYPATIDRTGLYAIRYGGDDALVGVSRPTRG